MPSTNIEWKTFNRHEQHHSADWYWATAIIAVAIIAVAVILHNLLFAIFIALSTVALFLRTLQKPRLERYFLTAKGIWVGKEFIPYASLESFWVEANNDPKLIIKSKKIFAPFAILPLGDTDPEAVREYVAAYLTEVEHHEPLSKKVMEFLGF